MTAVSSTLAAHPAPRTEASPSSAARTRAGRLSGLDGLRALAVVAVVAFHLDSSWLPGGFLGVDVFFVISGFLITRMLVTEVAETGGLRLGRFYARRARRLFPAVVALLLAVLAASAWIWTDQLATLRGALTSSLGYVTNWWLIFAHHSYFVSTGRPSMLQHLWSLAIEEQYYVVWSLVVLAVMCAFARGGRSVDERIRGLILLALILSLASTLAMACISIRTNVPYGADSSRVYFGTDTHSMGLLLGSAGGAWSVLQARRLRRRRMWTWPTELLAVGALAVVAWAFWAINEFVPDLYRGGFWALDVVVLIAVLAVTRPTSLVGRLLDCPPLRWLGLRSYSIYLWHWPIVVVTRPGVDLHGPTVVIQLARIGLILVLAAASYRFIEQPFRASRGEPSPVPPRTVSSRRVLRPAIAAGIGLVCTATMLVTALPAANAHPSLPVVPPPTAPSTPSPSASPTLTAGRHHRPAHPRPPAVPSHHGSASGGPQISAYGDSVLLGAQAALDRLDPNVHVDAVEGRQANATLDDVQADYRNGSLAPIVVIHTGDNGVIDPHQLQATLKMLRDRQRVVLLTDRVPRDWESPNNAIIEKAATQFSNVVLVDWHSIADTHPGWLYSDGIHLPAAGAAHYAQIVMAAALSG